MSLLILSVLLAAPMGASAAAAAPASAAEATGQAAKATKKSCHSVRVKKRTKSGKVVKRHGKPVYVKKKICKPSCGTVRVKKRTKGGKVVKRHGKPVYVKKNKKCKSKAKPKPKPPSSPAPSPTPSPPPSPSPAPPAPKIDQIVGWSTQGLAAATPPADLVPNGGTITSCPENDRLSVYVRQSGFSTPGLVTATWRRDGTQLTSSAVQTTIEGANRYFILDNTPPLLNGAYTITWTYGARVIGTASVTRNC